MKILIIGANGMLGHQIWKKLNTAYPGQVYGTVRNTPDYYSKFSLFLEENLIGQVDVTNFSTVENAVQKIKPTWIINCVGITLRKPDLNDMNRCIDINGMLPHKLGLLAESINAKLVHFSTDCVFDGRKGNYKESDLPTANDLYGKSKFLGEVKAKNALTLRLSIVGREIESKTELVEWFLSQKGKSIKGYSKAMYSGLTTNAVANELFNIINNHPDLSGLYQVSSEPISKFDLLYLLNDYFGTMTTIEAFDEYHSDKTLNCDRYTKATGFVKPSWSKMISEMAQDRSYDSRPF